MPLQMIILDRTHYDKKNSYIYILPEARGANAVPVAIRQVW